MCAGSEAEIRGKKVSLYMGYYGGNISIGDIKYDVDKKKSKVSREELISCLEGFEKHELAILIADLIDNSDE